MAVIPPVFFDGEFYNWLYRGLIFLVISCPCALVVSIPLGFFGGIGAASKQGVLIKGSNFLEGLNEVKIVIFDKTGTLTEGKFKVKKILAADPYTEREVLEYAAVAEAFSNHPIANSITENYPGKIDESLVENYTELSGLGVSAKCQRQKRLSGKFKTNAKV